MDEHLMLLEAARTRLEVEWAQTLAAFDALDGHDVLGYPSTVAYLKHRMRMSAARANRHVHTARTAVRFKATFDSWRHNQTSTDQAIELFRTAQRLPDEYRHAESGLLEVCGDTPAETKRIIDYWSSAVDRHGVILEGEDQLERRSLDYTRKANGMIEGTFRMTTVAGEALITGLDAVMPPPGPDDERTPNQRRHDALEGLARSYLDGTKTRLAGVERPNITVHVVLTALHGEPGGLHETQNGHVLTLEAIRQLACDASVTRVIFDPDSEIIDVGRKTRVVPAAMRRAVNARDRHCVHPGCDRDATWCDVHHIIHWADGGETVLSNLCLLCRYHHTLLHLEEAREDREARVAPALRKRQPIGVGRSTQGWP